MILEQTGPGRRQALLEQQNKDLIREIERLKAEASERSDRMRLLLRLMAGNGVADELQSLIAEDDLPAPAGITLPVSERVSKRPMVQDEENDEEETDSNRSKRVKMGDLI